MATYYRNKRTGEIMTATQFNAFAKKNPSPTSSAAPKGTPAPTGGGVKKYSFDTPEAINALPISTLTKSVIAGYGSLKDLTPTDTATVVKEMYTVGYNPKEYVNRKLEKLATLYETTPNSVKGMIQGRNPFRGQFGGAEFDSAREVLTREIARLNDVGVLSNQDVAAYRSAMPALSDRNIEVVRSKLAGLNVATGGGS